MNKALDLTRLAFPSLLSIAMLFGGCAARKEGPQSGKEPIAIPPTAAAAGKPAADAATEAKKSADLAVPPFETVNQVMAMPPCKATVEHRDEYSALLRTADGKKLTIGSDRSEQEVWHFVAMLKEGQTYEFPAALVAFEERKTYATADAINAMPACRAMVQVAGPCFSVFTATDGTIFVIGDPGSEAVVYRFLGSLKPGQRYELPTAFAEYQRDLREPPP